MKKNKFYDYALVLLLLIPCLTLAEETVTQLDDISITATKIEKNVLDQSGNIGLIDKAEIDIYRPEHIQQLIRRIPGVNVQKGNGQESLPAIRSPVLTGPGACGAFLFMGDGIPFRATGFCNNNGLAEAHMGGARSIEVVRGPGSSLYGSNAVHGLVNVITEAPSATLENNIIAGGTTEQVYKGHFSSSNTFNDHGYRLSVDGIRDNGWRTQSNYGEQKLTFRHDFFPSFEESIKNVFTAYNLNQETAGYKLSSDKDYYKERAQMKINDDPDAYRDWTAFRFSSEYQYIFENDDFVSVMPHFRTNDMEFRQHYLPSDSIEENGHSSAGLLLAYYASFGDHQLIFGSDLEYTLGYLKETQEKASYSSWGKNRQQGVHYDYDVDATVIAPYARAEWAITEKFQITTGLRAEYVRYDYDNKVASGTGMADGSECFAGAGTECLFFRPSDRTDEFFDVLPKIGMTYALSDTQSIFSNFKKGYSAPQTTELYRLQKHQTVGEIDSQEIESAELGIRHASKNISFEILAFWMRKDNFFMRDSEGYNVVNGKTDHKGAELSTSVFLTDNIDLTAQYSYAIHTYRFNNDASDITSGDDIDSAPRNLANAILGWDLNINNRVEFEWNHVGKYYLDTSNEHEYDGHNLFDFRFSSNIKDDITLNFQIENIANTAYADRADYAYGNYRFFPGRPRFAELSLSYDF